MSMMTGNGSNGSDSADCLFFGVDRLMNSTVVLETLSASTKMLIRVGGSIISTRILDWMSRLTMADNIRVRDDGFEHGRHDSTWISDFYIHASVGDFVRELARNLPIDRNNTAKSSNDVCPALLVLRIANKCHQEDLISLSSDPIFSEPQIALILQEVCFYFVYYLS